MTADTGPAVDVVAEVLAAHVAHLGATGNGTWYVECLGCDWTNRGDSGGMAAAANAHRPHVAAAVVAALAPSHTEAVRAALDEVERRIIETPWTDVDCTHHPAPEEQAVYIAAVDDALNFAARIVRAALADTATTTGADT